MKVGIFINTTKEEANKSANRFGGLLLNNGIESKVVNLKEDCKDIDVIAVFGGDGTILRVVEYAFEYDIPILAINTGSLGFLTCLESQELEKAVEVIKNVKNVEKRSIMKIMVNGKKHYALNEALIARSTSPTGICGVVKLSLELGGKFVDKYNSDGLIISTPTGSTAYSLSAGGAIITPDVSAFIATPICPHSLHNRPIVYPDSYSARITILENSAKCSLYIDGKSIKHLKNGESIEIVKSRGNVKFYKTQDNFFEKLLMKLNKWSETI